MPIHIALCIGLINLTSNSEAVRMPALLNWRKSLKKLLVLIFILIPAMLMAAQVATVCHNELSAWIKADKVLSIVDIQDAAGFREHNYEHALAAGKDPARLKKIAQRLKTAKGKVIVVSPTGGADASKAAELLAAGGVSRDRILVLEGGMEAAASNASCDCCKPAALKGETK
jgi:rhodanese-related sulfurtransferase